MKRFALLLIVAAAALGGLFALAGGMDWLTATGLLGQERLVRSRLDGYWQARVKGNLEEMAQYIHPEQRGIPDPGMLNTERYEVKSLAIDGERAVAVVDLRARLTNPVLAGITRDVTTQDVWVMHAGRWYREKQPVGIHSILKKAQEVAASGRSAPDPGAPGPGDVAPEPAAEERRASQQD